MTSRHIRAHIKEDKKEEFITKMDALVAEYRDDCKEETPKEKVKAATRKVTRTEYLRCLEHIAGKIQTDIEKIKNCTHEEIEVVVEEDSDEESDEEDLEVDASISVLEMDPELEEGMARMKQARKNFIAMVNEREKKNQIAYDEAQKQKSEEEIGRAHV